MRGASKRWTLPRQAGRAAMATHFRCADTCIFVSLDFFLFCNVLLGPPTPPEAQGSGFPLKSGAARPELCPEGYATSTPQRRSDGCRQSPRVAHGKGAGGSVGFSLT